jgi:hypothetical protein
MPQITENDLPLSAEHSHRSRARTALIRAGVAGGMALAFVLVASLIEPGASRASELGGGIVLPDGVSRDLPAAFYKVDSSSDLGRSLGELDGRKFRIEIVSGRGGEPATYRLLDANGSIVAEGLRADEVYTVDSDLTIDRMGDFPELDTPMTGGPLMLLEAAHD